MWAEPGKTYTDQRGYIYLIAKDGSLRRKNPNLTKAERKAAKRASRAARNKGGEP